MESLSGRQEETRVPCGTQILVAAIWERSFYQKDTDAGKSYFEIFPLAYQCQGLIHLLAVWHQSQIIWATMMVKPAIQEPSPTHQQVNTRPGPPHTLQELAMPTSGSAATKEDIAQQSTSPEVSSIYHYAHSNQPRHNRKVHAAYLRSTPRAHNPGDQRAVCSQTLQGISYIKSLLQDWET